METDHIKNNAQHHGPSDWYYVWPTYVSTGHYLVTLKKTFAIWNIYRRFTSHQRLDSIQRFQASLLNVLERDVYWRAGSRVCSKCSFLPQWRRIPR
jgi:hypothetical protein